MCLSKPEPSIKAQVSQEWMAEYIYDHIYPNIWSPNSSDLSPLDYYVCGIAKCQVNETPPTHTTKIYMKAAIVRLFVNMNPDHLNRTIRRFRVEFKALLNKLLKRELFSCL